MKSMIKLNHIGIAAADLPALKGLFSLLGLEVARTEPVSEQGVRTHFIPLSCQQASLELLEPIDPEGTVAKFLQKKGPGIHHLSFELSQGELGPLCERLRSAGVRLVYDAPRAGAHQTLINFIHPSSAGGLLIELMEKR